MSITEKPADFGYQNNARSNAVENARTIHRALLAAKDVVREANDAKHPIDFALAKAVLALQSAMVGQDRVNNAFDALRELCPEYPW